MVKQAGRRHDGDLHGQDEVLAETEATPGGTMATAGRDQRQEDREAEGNITFLDIELWNASNLKCVHFGCQPVANSH